MVSPRALSWPRRALGRRRYCRAAGDRRALAEEKRIFRDEKIAEMFGHAAAGRDHGALA